MGTETTPSARASVVEAITALGKEYEPTIVTVDVEGYERPFYVRDLPAIRRERFNLAYISNTEDATRGDDGHLEDWPQFRVWIVCLSLCDEGGRFALDPDIAEDVALIEGMAFDAFDALGNAAMRVNKMTKEQEDEMGKSSAPEGASGDG